ncbi:hypothetical protein PQB35_gp49 [Ochrobactrum phage vB_OspP_OH]|uniref:Uncharacterized protein n=1 Tax=Ochrobactrum phage vB_OspP_OH TaxID=2712957 RepID=A0A6G6XYK4_9CAUD|nr:hypothetical protein PQB35_gp49 [Ochrobactrum phage vB_OspP_OH]QIG66105.1 hypothetical protein phiOH_p49 [Ochrobactrum phage vB_OspP_OH]
MSRTVYHNADGVRRTSFTDSSSPHLLTVYTEVEMDEVLKNNAIMRELQPTRSTNKLVARGIPMTVVEKSMIEDWDDNDWKKWLNDPDNKAFRIWQGRV